VRDKVGQYAIEAHPEVAAQLDLAQLTQPIDRVNVALERAQTIDSAIAREFHLMCKYFILCVDRHPQIRILFIPVLPIYSSLPLDDVGDCHHKE
jgi:hypothetical protein